MKCAICEVRKPRRYCPGVQGEICTVCCGTERENTVDCPFDCVYLREARLREKPVDLAPEDVPFSEIRIPGRFLEERPRVAQLLIDSVAEAIFATPGAIDYDIRDAFDSLIRTYKTMQSGLVYETRPSNPIAAGIYERVQQNVTEGRKEIASTTGVSVRDAEVLTMLLILQRFEYAHNNGRRRGRAFIDFFMKHFPSSPRVNPSASPIIVSP